MKYYQVIEIRNEEPLKIGAGGNKTAHTEPCKDYIPGSTLRGAIIGQMLRLGVCDETALTPVLQHMACYNAYPYYEQSLYTPTPQHLRINKHQWREDRAKASGINQETGHTKLSNLIEGGAFKNTLDYRFIAIKNDVLQGIQVPKAYTLHHSNSLNLDLKEKENLFSYQAILPNQTFRAVISFEDDVSEPVNYVLQQINSWYLGGSKGSGYGLCSLKKIGEATTEYSQAKKWLGLEIQRSANEEKLTITCLSDCLFRNEYGQPVNHIPVSQLAELCGASVRFELEQQFVQAGISEGYNAKWQARYPKETTLKAGSVLVYRFVDSLDASEKAKLIAALEQRLAGFRTQEGFGWLAVNIAYPAELLTRANLRHEENEDMRLNGSLKPEVDLNAEAVMAIMGRGLQNTRDRWLSLIIDRSLDNSDAEANRPQLIFSNGFSNQQYLSVRDIIVHWLKEPGFDIAAQLLPGKNETYYQICSIAGSNFKEIVNFLAGNEEADQDQALAKYAEFMLNSRSGRMYYAELAKKEAQQKFIAELLSEGLYIRARRPNK